MELDKKKQMYMRIYNNEAGSLYTELLLGPKDLPRAFESKLTFKIYTFPQFKEVTGANVMVKHDN